jgi:RHS repeat-associated protein
MIAELDGADDSRVRTYTWGLDMSDNSIESAGGVGGLLAMHDFTTTPAKSYLVCYDGNGNVGQVLLRSSGSIEARYEYDAYGNQLLDLADPNQSGPYADTNAFRFSTKWWDDETGFGYWGYRYYSAGMGRWLSRDPIQEEGGTNLYAYVDAAPISAWDSLGLKCACWVPSGGPETDYETRTTSGGIRLQDGQSMFLDNHVIDFKIKSTTVIGVHIIGPSTRGGWDDATMPLFFYTGWRWPSTQELSTWAPPYLNNRLCKKKERCYRTCKCDCPATPLQTKRVDGSERDVFGITKVNFGLYSCDLFPDNVRIYDKDNTLVAINPPALDCSKTPKCSVLNPRSSGRRYDPPPPRRNEPKP